MSYNVLATTLTNEFEYGINPEYIKWENRFPAIKLEISYVNPDILCLQETEEHTGLHEYLNKELGYKYEYFKK
jgi:mRNA deadenylase 3'-5' endonuclease subunit Ccr4